ncbi:phage tail protein [Kitasatospora sp. NPDC088346]|uniref:phage tail protein n=1 Tax=Kitasatospora sp. NPDC088346 TaxID=3364073 RepID=UPI0038090F38
MTAHAAPPHRLTAGGRPTSRSLRRAVDGLVSPHPLIDRLPGIYTEDDFTRRFVSAFDQVLAPVFAVLDCLHVYWDPALAPSDFVDWLAGWVAAQDSLAAAGTGERPPGDDSGRAVVAGAVPAQRSRGTLRGVVAQLSLLGVAAQVSDSGGASWSATPNGPLPGVAGPALLVRITAGDAAAVSPARVREVVERERPAHVVVRLEVLPG